MTRIGLTPPLGAGNRKGYRMAQLILAGLVGLFAGLAIGVFLGYWYNIWFITQAVRRGKMRIYKDGRWITKEDYGNERI